MDAARNARSILDAWRIHDGRSLGAALERASVSNRTAKASSAAEAERGEVLESIIEHLRKLDAQGEVPARAASGGAAALLLHLSFNGRALRAEDQDFLSE